ncbi:MAG: 4Fe-4S binding protein [Armatimonadota bacterium]
MSLTTRIWGLTLANPVVVAPSPVTECLRGIIAAEQAGAGAVITKSVGPHNDGPEPGTDRRQVRYYRGLGMWMQSTYRREILPLRDGERLVRDAKQRVGIPVIGSVFSASFDVGEWTRLACALADAGADAVHLDFFYLPVDRPLGDRADALRSILETVVGAVSVPVVVKLSMHSDWVGIATVAEQTGAAGLCYLDSARLGNPRQPEDPSIYMLPGPPASMCALAGEWLRPLTMHCTDQLRQMTSMDLCAGGGLTEAWHGVEALVRGADAIQLCTAILVDGWHVIGRFTDAIQAFLTSKQLASMDELRAARLLPAFATADAAPAVRARVLLDLCSGCGRCTEVTICEAIGVEGGRASVDGDACEGCGLCASICPARAIVMGA